MAEAIRRCRRTYRFQVRSQPALIGADRRTQFSPLQALTQQHSAALDADSQAHLKQTVLDWLDNRPQQSQAPSGAIDPPASQLHASQRYSQAGWRQPR
eukprot:4023919-Amphidinium_carterae.1